jgi:UDP-GlcNAc3NAcA epimerase
VRRSVGLKTERHVMRIVSIVGARPQFVKLAPICRAVEAHNRAGGVQIAHVIVHTGQHYDPELSDIFFDELEIPKADINLGVGSGPHGQQTGRMLEAFERFLLESKPDAVIVYGDTNSTIAGALVAVKQHVPVAHVEAGLRSFNRLMPEEINRIATDHVSDVLYAPTQTAMNLLAGEGLAHRAVLTGDVGYDAVLFNRGLAAKRSRILEQLGLGPQTYAVLTVHRSENTEAGRLIDLLGWLGEIAADGMKFIFPIHPRTARYLPRDPERFNQFTGVRLIKPIGFLDMLQLVGSSRMVLTDSGGVQKEAFFLGTPCVTLREETEWTETVEAGANVLVGFQRERIRRAVRDWETGLRAGRWGAAASAEHPFGSGDAARRIVAELVARYSRQSRAVAAGA